MEHVQLRCFFRPAQCGEGPQRRAEPGIQHVFVLTQRHIGSQSVVSADFRFIAANIHFTVDVIPCRDAVTPPQLTGDTPVLNITHPGEVHVFILFRYELNTAILHRFNRRFRQHVRTHIPLVGQHWLDRHTTTVAVRLLQYVIFDLVHQAFGFQCGNDRFTRRITLQTGEFSRHGSRIRLAWIAFAVIHFRFSTNMRIQREDVDHWQMMTFTHFMVIEIVRRSDLHTASAFFHVGMFVSHDRNTTAHQRQLDKLANQRFVTRIFRVHCHRSITQHGFRTRGRYDQVIVAFSRLLAIRQRIAQMPHVAFDFFVLNFQIRDRGMQFRIPVHQTFAAIDQILFIQTYEHFLYRM
eukprot:RCo023910